MLGRLEAERVRAMVNAMLATNGRSLPDDAQSQFLRSLDGEETVARPRAPKATLAFLQRAGIQMSGKGGE